MALCGSPASAPLLPTDVVKIVAQFTEEAVELAPKGGRWIVACAALPFSPMAALRCARRSFMVDDASVMTLLTSAKAPMEALTRWLRDSSRRSGDAPRSMPLEHVEAALLLLRLPQVLELPRSIVGEDLGELRTWMERRGSNKLYQRLCASVSEYFARSPSCPLRTWVRRLLCHVVSCAGGGLCLLHLHDAARGDVAVASSAVRYCHVSLKCVAPEVRHDETVLINMVEGNGGSCLPTLLESFEATTSRVGPWREVPFLRRFLPLLEGIGGGCVEQRHVFEFTRRLAPEVLEDAGVTLDILRAFGPQGLPSLLERSPWRAAMIELVRERGWGAVAEFPHVPSLQLMRMTWPVADLLAAALAKPWQGRDVPEYEQLTGAWGWSGPPSSDCAAAACLETTIAARFAPTSLKLEVWRRVRRSRAAEHEGVRRALASGHPGALLPFRASNDAKDREAVAAWPEVVLRSTMVGCPPMPQAEPSNEQQPTALSSMPPAVVGTVEHKAAAAYSSPDNRSEWLRGAKTPPTAASEHVVATAAVRHLPSWSKAAATFLEDRVHTIEVLKTACVRLRLRAKQRASRDELVSLLQGCSAADALSAVAASEEDVRSERLRKRNTSPPPKKRRTLAA